MGEDIELYHLENPQGLELELYNFGARMSSIRIPSTRSNFGLTDVLLGYQSINDFLQDYDHMNGLVGRVSNRISQSQFELNGTKFLLSQNEGENHLHGGFLGFDRKVWKFLRHSEEFDNVSLSLGLTSQDLEEGYPGCLEIEITFKLNRSNRLILEMKAISNKDTILSMTNHNYWNFNGHGEHYADVSNHILRIPSLVVCETGQNNLPTGQLLRVDGTKLDFFDARRIGGEGIDLNYCFGNQSSLEIVAEVYSPATGLGVAISSDLPGVQCYTGGSMSKKSSGKSGRTYGRGFGLCLEPQFYPDAINQPTFPSPILKAKEPYQKVIQMDFRNDY